MTVRSFFLVPAALAGVGTPVFAGSVPNAAHVHVRDNQAGEIIVTGVRREAGDVLGGISVLDEADLIREVRPSLGETLARQPGVSATSFGPTASAPILRGLSGDRIRVLTDDIGSLDLSTSGPDHAIAINPLTAERIEVLRGPAALLFGSSAIGGVVNVIDSRIPRQKPDGPGRVGVVASYGSAADERSVNGSVDLPLGGHLVAHGDVNWSKSDDLQAGGYFLSKRLREEAASSPSSEIRELAGLKGEIPNSAANSHEFSGGVAYIDNGLNIGASITRRESEYGVPIRYSLDPDGEVEAPTIDARQTRYDTRIEAPLGGVFEQLRVRAGYANYRHDEVEDTGEIGSSFFSKGGEGRLELVQADRSGWGGSSGFQFLERNAKIRGEEKFLPDSRQRQAGLFTLQTIVAGRLRIEAGGRVELSKLRADADDQLGTPGRSPSFTTFSGSLGGQYEFTSGWRAGLTMSSSARAPSINELFANGPHVGSQAFEIGDPDLDPERSLSIEGSLRHQSDPLRLTINAYYSRFSNYIFQAPTGGIDEDSGLAIYEFRQGRANYYGIEAEAQAKLGPMGGIDWGLEAIGDAVRAKVRGFGPAPQIPPARVIAALTGAKGQFDGRFEIEHAFAQRRTASLETDTPAYTLVGASLDWHPFTERPELTLSLSGNNLFDVVARRHSSLLKDYAPLAGRDVRLGLRFEF